MQFHSCSRNVNCGHLGSCSRDHTSTTATPLVNNNAYTNNAGIVLQSFFESDSVAYDSFTDIASSDLAASGVTEAYNYLNLDGPRSLNLFFSEEPTLQTFDTSTRAFTGSIVIDMTNSAYGGSSFVWCVSKYS